MFPIGELILGQMLAKVVLSAVLVPPLVYVFVALRPGFRQQGDCLNSFRNDWRSTNIGMPEKGHPMDITQLIADDHAEQRRLFAAIDQLRPSDGAALKAVWSRLHALLDTHAEAEERFFYPELLKIGRGAADSDSAADETRDAIKDHNEIRDTAAKVDTQDVGTAEWFEAVAAANKANGDHMAEEERQGLSDFRRHGDLALRHRLGVDFARFSAEHLTGVQPVDKDVDAYVLQNDERARRLEIRGTEAERDQLADRVTLDGRAVAARA